MTELLIVMAALLTLMVVDVLQPSPWPPPIDMSTVACFTCQYGDLVWTEAGTVCHVDEFLRKPCRAK